MIREIHNTDEKQRICRRVLDALPDWFGIPGAVDEYVARSRELPFWAAVVDEDVVGFIAVQPTAPQAAEIHVMGIHPDHHRQGIGRSLVEQAAAWARGEGLRYLHLKTLDASHPDPRYAATNRFYESVGFTPLESIPQIWGEDNPCLIMVMHIG